MIAYSAGRRLYINSAYCIFTSALTIGVIALEVKRNEARNTKNYDLADKIRNELLDKGVLIEDKDGKTIWKIK